MNSRLKIEYVPLGRLTPFMGNPRRISPENLARLGKSLGDFGIVDPVIAQRGTGIVIGGHQRLEAAKTLGLAEVPVVWLDIDDGRARALNIALNNPNLQGEWDDEKLGALLEELRAAGTSDGTGFAEGEIDTLLADLASREFRDKEEDFDLEAALESQGEPRIKTGEVWQLGRHRLMCGDSTKEEDVAKLMGGVKVGAVITDPPYGINLDTDYSNPHGHGVFRGRAYRPLIGDDKPFNASQIREMVANASEQFWFGANYYYRTLGAADGAGSWLVWDKRVEEEKDAVIGSAFELCWSANKHAQRILRYQWTNWTSHYNEGMRREHPTEKPIAMIKEIIERWIDKAAIICDPFLGSGATLIAAEKLGRICYGMEIEPRYCEVAIQRWEAFTSQKAELCS